MINFFLLLLLVLTLDALWIDTFFKYKFFPMIESVQKVPLTTNIPYVIIAYLILVTLIYIIIPKCSSVEEAFFIGFLVYAVYDSTNLATLKDWDISVALMDSLWGGVLFTIIYVIENENNK